jgi:hypothetical protein
MVYLGVPISDHKLSLEQFVALVQSLTLKLDPWQGRTMSSGARLTWSNVVWTICQCFKWGFTFWEHGEMDSVRQRFFWESCGKVFKYHMMKWECVCRPKDFRGLRLVNTRLMNIYLLLKWVWKPLHGDEDSPWPQIIYKKYLTRGFHSYESE